ncbi:carbohydrate kinase family protein [Anaeromicropila herbilytica]|uniref:Fructokinase n=1 Tax=Anaeromicropila herbilytica TaxID=2785025 RepID=A0A7R7EIX9_9FIRM|nr:carbohydrate kinase [Anaeromicropila herbilytica]BCN29282.1 fructokinase [Anaeromicropila herbilytica]
MKEKKVVALGELLIDFTENGMSDQNNPVYEANPGGAPCNVLAMLTKLGTATSFIGKVGRDQFGQMLRQRVTKMGIDTTYLYEDEKVHTTLAFVHTFEDGDRDFSFYRNPGADMMLSPEEIPHDLIKTADIFHFGTLSMTHDGVRAATKKAVEFAKKAGCMISFDPNLRPPLWESLELAKEQTAYGMEHCDILKISDNEVQWFTGKENFDEGISCIQEQYQIPLIVLSMGKEGSRAYYGNTRVEEKSFLQRNTIETTGAGDTFGACILQFVLEHGIKNLTDAQLSSMLTFANAAASIITTKKGALCVMPEKEEILSLIEGGGRNK